MASQHLFNCGRPEELRNELGPSTADVGPGRPAIANAFSTYVDLDAESITQPLAMLSRIHMLTWLLLEALMAHASIRAIVSFAVPDGPIVLPGTFNT